jgi:hypothetical protein
VIAPERTRCVIERQCNHVDEPEASLDHGMRDRVTTVSLRGAQMSLDHSTRRAAGLKTASMK